MMTRGTTQLKADAFALIGNGDSPAFLTEFQERSSGVIFSVYAGAGLQRFRLS
jgi:hypothetical protein